MSKPLSQQLESLSGYRHLFPPGTSGADKNPVVRSFVTSRVGGQEFYILSRIADAGLDYSGRSNKLAHHIVLDGNELRGFGPASLLGASGLHLQRWDGEPRFIPPRELPIAENSSSAECELWNRIAGDRSWADYLVHHIRQRKTVLIVYPLDIDPLPLLVEAESLLEPQERWLMTFSTYVTRVPSGVDCLVRCVLVGTEEAKWVQARHDHPQIDFTNPKPAPKLPTLHLPNVSTLQPNRSSATVSPDAITLQQVAAPSLEQLPELVSDVSMPQPPEIEGRRRPPDLGSKRRIVNWGGVVAVAAMLMLLVTFVMGSVIWRLFPSNQRGIGTSSHSAERIPAEPPIKEDPQANGREAKPLSDNEVRKNAVLDLPVADNVDVADGVIRVHDKLDGESTRATQVTGQGPHSNIEPPFPKDQIVLLEIIEDKVVTLKTPSAIKQVTLITKSIEGRTLEIIDDQVVSIPRSDIRVKKKKPVIDWLYKDNNIMINVKDPNIAQDVVLRLNFENNSESSIVGFRERQPTGPLRFNENRFVGVALRALKTYEIDNAFVIDTEDNGDSTAHLAKKEFKTKQFTFLPNQVIRLCNDDHHVVLELTIGQDGISADLLIREDAKQPDVVKALPLPESLERFKAFGPISSLYEAQEKIAALKSDPSLEDYKTNLDDALDRYNSAKKPLEGFAMVELLDPPFSSLYNAFANFEYDSKVEVSEEDKKNRERLFKLELKAIAQKLNAILDIEELERYRTNSRAPWEFGSAASVKESNRYLGNLNDLAVHLDVFQIVKDGDSGETIRIPEFKVKGMP